MIFLSLLNRNLYRNIRIGVRPCFLVFFRTEWQTSDSVANSRGISRDSVSLLKATIMRQRLLQILYQFS